MWRGPNAPCYVDDISEILWSKEPEDIKQWMAHTNRMIEKLTMNPDPDKPEPTYLIKKLASRVKQMQAHLKKLNSSSAQPRTILPGSPLKRSNTIEKKSSITYSAPMNSLPNLTPMEERVQLRCTEELTPSQEEALNQLSLPSEIDMMIEKQGQIFVPDPDDNSAMWENGQKD